MTDYFRYAVRRIDDNSKLIDDVFVIRRQTSPPAQYLWKGDDGSWYTHEKAPDLLLATIPVPPGTGPYAAVFTLGKSAFIKIRNSAWIRSHSKPGLMGCTDEHVTLAWLAERRDRLSFAIPKVLHFQREEDAEYLITSSVPGTLADAWRGMPGDERRHYAGRIIDICEKLASTWTSNAMTGVDGRRLFEN
ncbi:hypothetical protein RB595_005432 [Gaeumannomyces hyphopodioides]